MPKVRTYTDETKLGHINDDLDAIYTAVEADTNIDDLADVVITSPADNEVLAYDTGSGDWINQTAAEAGLATSGHDHDSTYLKLDASNDPVTAALEVNDSITISDAVNPQLILNDSGGTYDYTIESSGDYLKIFEDSTVKGRFYSPDNVWQWVAPSSQPSTFNSAVGFYQKETEDELWAVWKESGGTQHHARVARANRTVVSLGAGEAIYTSGITMSVGGASTDVGLLQFPDASTQSAAWSFVRPADWDYGEIQVTVYWTNSGAAVTGNHYCPQRLTGWADAEDIGTPNGNTILSGAQTVTGLNNAGKIGTTTIAAGSSSTLTNEEFFQYRWQRQGGNPSDTSGQPWHIIQIKIELIATT